jgi:hypothetical protein
MFARTFRPRLVLPLLVVIAASTACASDDEGSDPTDVPAASSTMSTDPTATLDDQSDDPATATTVPQTPIDTTTPTSQAENGDDADGTATTIAASASDPRLDVLEPRVGTWVVGDAGEVDIDLTADGLVLLDVRAAPGWQVSVDEAAPDEIEVDFEQGNVEWQIEVQWENSILEIEIDQDIDPAEPGVIQVGVAGSVEFALGPNGLVLVAVDAQEQWDAAVTTESSDEIVVVFVNGLADYEVEIDLDDGEIDIEVDFEVEGPFTP